MRIAIVRTSKKPLDIQTYNCQELGLASGLVKYGHQIDIFSQFNKLEKIEYADGAIKLIPIVPTFKFKDFTFYRSLVKILMQSQYDLIQIHEDSQLMSPLIARAFRRQKVAIVLYQGMYLPFTSWKGVLQKLFDRLLNRSLKNNITFAFAKTTMAKEYLESKGYRNVQLLPVGFFLPERAEDNNLDKQVVDFCDAKSKVLSYVGVLESRRNPEFLVEVFYELLKSSPSLGLIIVGSGPYMEKVKNLILKFGLADSILWLESIPNNKLWLIFERTQLFLLPTNYEIFGMTILEALYFGSPVLSTPTAGPLEIIGHDSRLGSICELKHELWCKEIEDLLSNESSYDREWRNLYVQDNYSWDKISNNYLSSLISK